MAEENNNPGAGKEESLPVIDQMERMLEPEQEALTPGKISGGVFDCALDFARSFGDRNNEENQAEMNRIVKCGQSHIEKMMNAELKKVNED